MNRVHAARARNTKSATEGNYMTDKKPDAREVTNDMFIADIMLRLTAIENLLIAKGVFTQGELSSTMEDVAKKVAKIVIEKAQASKKNMEELMVDLEDQSKEKKEFKN